MIGRIFPARRCFDDLFVNETLKHAESFIRKHVERIRTDTYDCFYTKETRSFTRRARFIFPSRKIETVRAPMAASFLDLESAHGCRWTSNGSADDANSQNSRKLPTTLFTTTCSIHLTRWLKPRERFYDETKKRVSLETWLI